MEKREIGSSQLRIVKNELDYFKAKGIISEEQLDLMVSEYAPSKRLNFISILLIIGSVLIGLGVISFVASNWQGMSTITKMTIIVLSLILSQLSSYLFRNKSTAASRALLYLTILIFGAGLFLIAQILGLSESASSLLLIWTLGSLAMTYLFNEDGLFIITCGLLMIFITNNFNYLDIIRPVLAIIVLFILYFYVYKIRKNALLFCATNLPFVLLILYLLDFVNSNDLTKAIIILCIGLILYYLPIFKDYIVKIEATIIYSVAALTLTETYIYIPLTGERSSTTAAIIFSVVLLIYLLYQTKLDNITALIFVGITILKLYTSTFYKLMPKSLFFITAGAILFAFGYYFEKKLKANIGGIKNEK